MLHLLKKSLALISSLTVLLALGAVSASAETSYEPSGSFAITTGSGDGEVVEPRDDAVRTATSEVFVVDQGNNRVQVFAPDGAGSATYVTQFGTGVLNTPLGIAIDQASGAVYVSDANGVLKFTSDGLPVPTFTQDITFAAPTATGPLAFDQDADQLLVADTATNTVRRYGTGGAAGATFDGATSGSAFTGLADIAVQDDGDVIVIDAKRAVRFTDDNSFAAVLPDLPGDPDVVTAVPGTDNLLVGQSGGYTPDFSAVLDSAQLYRYTGDAYKGTTILPTTMQGLSGLAVSGDADHNLYAATRPGIFVGGDTAVQVLAPFTIQAPVVTGLNAVASAHGARLSADINPNRDSTSWSFEYGPTAAYGDRFPVTPATIQPGEDPVTVARTIGGLEPGTTYHYRVTATNGGGTINSTDKTFTTKAASSPPGEEAARGDRHFEQVTPIDKAGSQAGTAQQTVQSNAAGDRVAYNVPTAFPGAPTNLLYQYYMGRRSASGWSNESIDDRQIAYDPVFAETVRPTLYFSNDLMRAFQYSSAVLAPGAVEGNANLYFREDDGTRQTGATGTRPEMRSLVSGGERKTTGASADLSHVAFSVPGKLTDDAPAGQNNVYEAVRGGGARLVNYLPDGSPSGPAYLGGYGFSSPTARPVSRDGRKIIFDAGPVDFSPQALYMRIDGTTTVPLSVSHRPGDPDTPEVAEFGGASEDGRYVVFSSRSGLTSDSIGTSDALYRLDTETHELIDLTASAGTGFFQTSPQTVNVSADGSTVAFFSAYPLLPGDEPGLGNHAYLWSAGVLHSLGVLPDSAGQFIGPSFSPDGKFFAFSSVARLTAFDNSNPGGCKGGVPFEAVTDPLVSGVCEEVYVFDVDAERLSCVTCVGKATNAHSFMASYVFTRKVSNYIPRSVHDDGTIFFTSLEQLVDADTNGVSDVYSWNPETGMRLISGGSSETPSIFRDASADGSDVFFTTAESLVSQDTDTALDLYVSRPGAPIAAGPSTAQTPCTGDDCQGRPTESPQRPSPASDTASGGDAPPSIRPAARLKTISSRSRSALAKTGRSSIAVSVTGHGTISLTATAVIDGRKTVIGRVSRTATRSGTLTLNLRLSAAGRRQIARGRTVRMTLTLRMSGDRSSHVKIINLKKGR
jgi:hypothetical protein